jgi:predicted nucleotide-binding protein
VQLRELAPGEVLIRQDGDDNDLFFVISGSLNVEANGRVVAVRTAGTHVGEMALIDSKACRCATVRASERTVVANVLEADFSRIADEYPTLWRRIAVELCDRLRNRNRMIFPPNEVPQIFICSSTESLPVAERIQLGLDHHASVARVWTDQVFGPMKQTMEDLEREVSYEQKTAVSCAEGQRGVRAWPVHGSTWQRTDDHCQPTRHQPQTPKRSTWADSPHVLAAD